MKIKPHLKLVAYGRINYMVWAVYRTRQAKRPVALCRVFETACAKAKKMVK